MESLTQIFFLSGFLLIGVVVGWCGHAAAFLRNRSKSQTRRVNTCSMCYRSTTAETVAWHIRGQSVEVCQKCHPFYRRRFATHAETDTRSLEAA